MSAAKAKLLYRIDEVADMLSISEGQVRQLLDNGTLKAQVVNSRIKPRPKRIHIRVHSSSVISFLADPEMRIVDER